MQGLEEAVTHTIDWQNVAPVVRDFVHDPTFVTGFFGPLGCGKTSSGVMKAWSYAQAWPGAQMAVIRTTWPRLRDTTMVEFFKWFPKAVAGHYEATPKIFHLHTGTSYGPEATITNEPAHILFRSMDDQKDIDNLLSLSLAAAWVDEPQGGIQPVGKTFTTEPGLDHSLFLSLLSRLGRQPGYLRMCWLTGNPPDPSHWIAKEFRYAGKGAPTNPRKRFRLYLGDQDTNRRNLYHHFVGTKEEAECRLCGKAWDEVIHQQGDYYEDLEELFGHGTALALRFIQGLWVPFKALKPFDLSWIAYVSDLPQEGRPTIADCFNVLAVDPAITKNDEGCRSSLTLAGVPREGIYRANRFVWRNQSDHWSPYELCDKILDWLEDFPIRKLRIEKVAWQSALKDIVEREAKLRGVKLPYIDLAPPRGDKLLRAHRWSPGVENGSILFDPSCKDLIECMADVPMNKMAWDPVDATGIALEGLPQKHAERSPVAHAEASPEKKRFITYAPKAAAPAAIIRRGPIRLLGRELNARLKARARGYAPRV